MARASEVSLLPKVLPYLGSDITERLGHELSAGCPPLSHLTTHRCLWALAPLPPLLLTSFSDETLVSPEHQPLESSPGTSVRWLLGYRQTDAAAGNFLKRPHGKLPSQECPLHLLSYTLHPHFPAGLTHHFHSINIQSLLQARHFSPQAPRPRLSYLTLGTALCGRHLNSFYGVEKQFRVK